MVGVAQLVEHPVVVRDVAGSSPVAHPINTLVTARFKQLQPKPSHQLVQKLKLLELILVFQEAFWQR